MSLYEDFLALGYTENEVEILTYLAKNSDKSAFDVDIDEISEAIVDEFNRIGCTSFHLESDEIAKLLTKENS